MIITFFYNFPGMLPLLYVRMSRSSIPFRDAIFKAPPLDTYNLAGQALHNVAGRSLPKRVDVGADRVVGPLSVCLFASSACASAEVPPYFTGHKTPRSCT